MEKGYPKLASKIASLLFASSGSGDFRARFVEIFLSACEEAGANSAPKHIMKEIAASVKILRESLAPVAQSATDYFQLGRLNELYVLEESETNLESAVRFYEKAMELGDSRAVPALSELLFRSEMNDE